MTDIVYYAIGDIHGEAKRLCHLHELILADIAAHGAPATIVHLGDMIDRGSRSRDVVAQVLHMHEAAAALDMIKVVTLRGNHEQMMLDAIEDETDSSTHHWLRNGGDSALASYEVANGMAEGDWRDAVDKGHIAFLKALPTMAIDEARRLVFVHAGIDPRLFPECPERVRLWSRSPRFFNTEAWPDRPELDGMLVVHGHTPTKTLTPYVHARRINVDTGAVFGGPLTAVVLAAQAPPRFMTA